MHKGEALFPRIDVKKEIEYLEAEDAKQKAAAEAAAAPKAEEKKEEAVAEITDHEPEISFDDFCKVELRVAEVRACENMKNELQTYENNLGFLTASSKKGNSLLTELNRKVEKLKGDIELVKQKIKVIDNSINEAE